MSVRSRLKVLIAQRNVERLQRGEQELTQQQIAEACGLSLSTVNGLTSGRSTRVDFDTLDKLCAYFNVEPGDLLERVPEREG